MNNLSNTLERLMNDTRVRIGAAGVGGLIIVTSLIVANACQAPVRLAKVAAVLPEYPLNLPMVRRLQPPEPKKVKLVSSLKRVESKQGPRGALTAHR
jgi:hypothetical protein